ncbi:hypothetical protein [Pararhizobium antarcticum]|uniref:TnsA endonuclease N-terminal domain-containing protein n=1 Tax=Pararhizobium antarcticum TaxID=1798805 RepID=A0A657LY45_9HYPH|nr:hypothetical protein [Pararhizobium antarcticum]OJF89616.1 hypothetical protein AX761_24310 [Rhizobium sp. 58]OJG00181.1 hypothetical protein AX760_10645 [Pararhizobium antarcticum]
MPRNSRVVPGFDPDHKPVYDVPRRKKHQAIPHVVPTRKSVNRSYVRVSQPLSAELMMRLETDPRVVLISPFPTKVECVVYDRYGPVGHKCYNPEIGVMMVDGSYVYMDVVPRAIQLERPGIARRTDALRRACREKWGIHYAVHNELSLRIEPQWSNIQKVWRHLWVDDLKALMAVRQVIDQVGPWTTIGEVRRKAKLACPIWRTDDHDTRLDDVDRSFSALMQLYARGHIRLDLSRPFSDDTVVSLRMKNALTQMKGAA